MKLTKKTNAAVSPSTTERPAGLPEVGALYIDDRNDYNLVVRVWWTGADHKYHPNEWRITYRDLGQGSNDRTSDCDLDDWERMRNVRAEQDTPEAVEAWALAEFSRPTLDAKADEAEPESDSRALTRPDAKDKLLAQQQRAEAAVNRAALIQRSMAARLARLDRVQRDMLEQLSVVKRNIAVIELYLGVNEQIVQLRDGEPASAETPVAFRQLVLYMDEEYGDPRKNAQTGQPGLDWACVEDFDAWLLAANNLDRVLPERKGAVVLKPSRQKRTYSDNAFLEAAMQEKNAMAYLLIRNGERVWRVWTNEQMGTKFFPGPDELVKLFSAAEASHFKQRDAEAKEWEYKRNALIMQGLLDRSDIFRPIAAEVNLFDATDNDLVRFIYDAEPSLTTGRLTWREWKAQVNRQIKRGSRVVLAGNMRSAREGYGHDFILHRLARRMNYAPPGPEPGLYTVEAHPHGEQAKYHGRQFAILYNPGDMVQPGGWGGWRHYDERERKLRLSFAIYPDDDAFVLNYDGITLEDIEYYLHSRIDRVNYLDMMPTLWALRDERLAELEWERGFVTLVAQRLKVDEAEVWEAVEWWKNKVIWKRPLTKDDAKALRMIERKLRGQSTDDQQEGQAE